MANELILMLHPSFGVLAILASLWVFVEVLNTESRVSAGRIRVASLACAVLMWLSYLVGGYWYVLFYGADKALINAGPWPFAHSFFMETKEHVFFTLLLLASYLPVAAFSLTSNRAVRTLVLSVAGLIIVLGLAMEGAGAFISMGSKMALLGKVAAGM
jgi:hypothetical protein